MEMAAGLNYLQNGQWVESKEQIDVLQQGGAAATQGQHQVYFPSDIYQGAIELVTPEGTQLQSRPMGLFYDDGTNVVMIAQLTNSIGQLVSSNKVVYPDAFDGIRADLVYTYRKSGFEQDVVLREQPPTPESLGFDSQSTRLQLLTEFFNPPEPERMQSTASMDGLTDTTLKFGGTIFKHGKAFVLEREDVRAPVYKQWLELQGRTFLMEEVPIKRIAAALQSLPSANVVVLAIPTNSILYKTSVNRLLVPSRLVQRSGTNAVQLAKADINKKPGVVLDYATISSGQTNFIFQGDTTYYISGEYNLSGTTTIEGGAVIKMNGSGQIDIDQNGAINCQTGPYHPAVFTSFNDDSVGESISGSSGSPGDGNVWNFLNIGPTNVTVHDLRFGYCWVGISQAGWGAIPAMLDVWNCQFKKVDAAVYAYNIGLHNVLIYGVGPDPNVFVEGLNMFGENITADSAGDLVEVDNFPATVALTNCFITRQSFGSGMATLLTNHTVCLPSPGAPVYQTFDGGAYYLTNGSPYRNAGTTNISPALLSMLEAKTTYPPVSYSNWDNLQLGPQAQRDVDTPDLGYHYNPLDYVMNGENLDAGLRFQPGTVVGGTIYLNDLNSSVRFNGTVTQPCWFVTADTVQENGGFAGANLNTTVNAIDCGGVGANFTKFSTLADEGTVFFSDPEDIYPGYSASNCEFYGGNIGGGGVNSEYNIRNCLFWRTDVGEDYGDYWVFTDCTFWNGTFAIEGNATVMNSAFDRTTMSLDLGSLSLTADYNSFLTNADWLPVTGGHDITNLLSYSWQSSWFGAFYLPLGSSLVDHGSTTADQVGLYHFTTQTNQLKETNSVVDIGYHYVATDAYGNPIDTNGNGIPDYIEDGNGNGIFDAGDGADWLGSPLGTVTFPNGMNIFIFEPKPTSNAL